jgi:predicted DNA-binding transcriptional regulator AlpA
MDFTDSGGENEQKTVRRIRSQAVKITFSAGLTETVNAQKGCYNRVYAVEWKDKSEIKAYLISVVKSYSPIHRPSSRDICVHKLLTTYQIIMNPEYPLLTSKQVQNILSISKTTLHRWRNDGIFPHPVNLGGNCVRYRRKDIEKFIEGLT